jgi:hypothetical protein
VLEPHSVNPLASFDLPLLQEKNNLLSIYFNPKLRMWVLENGKSLYGKLLKSF